MEKIKAIRDDARTNFGRGQDSRAKKLAQFQRKASDSLEGLVSRNLEERGRIGTWDDFVNARQQYRKIMDVERSLNSAGKLSPQKLAKNVGADATGEFGDIARAFQAMPAYMKPYDKGYSILDPSNTRFSVPAGLLAGLGAGVDQDEDTSALGAGLSHGLGVLALSHLGRGAMIGRSGQTVLDMVPAIQRSVGGILQNLPAMSTLTRAGLLSGGENE